MIAGRDTTGQTLTWLFYLLSQNPQVESKVFNIVSQWTHFSVQLLEEIDALNGVIPDYRELNQLYYLHGVINETLRLYPPVPFDLKYALEDDVLPNGYFIQKGSSVFWSAWVMGRHQKFWKDPLKMDPTRWIGLDISKVVLIFCRQERRNSPLFIYSLSSRATNLSGTDNGLFGDQNCYDYDPAAVSLQRSAWPHCRTRLQHHSQYKEWSSNERAHTEVSEGLRNPCNFLYHTISDIIGDIVASCHCLFLALPFFTP